MLCSQRPELAGSDTHSCISSRQTCAARCACGCAGWIDPRQPPAAQCAGRHHLGSDALGEDAGMRWLDFGGLRAPTLRALLDGETDSEQAASVDRFTTSFGGAPYRYPGAVEVIQLSGPSRDLPPDPSVVGWARTRCRSDPDGPRQGRTAQPHQSVADSWGDSQWRS